MCTRRSWNVSLVDLSAIRCCYIYLLLTALNDSVTKKEVEYLQKGLTKNGDIDFIDMVKLRYQWPLSYLTEALEYRTKNSIEQHEFIEDGEDDDDDSMDDGGD